MIIAVDYDGTVVPKLPEGFCEVDTGAERVLRKLVEAGHLLVLWTCRNNSIDNPYNFVRGMLREESSLEEAMRWFDEHNIPLYGINDVPNQSSLIGKSRKLLYDILIDDTSLGIPLVFGEVNYVSYETGEICYNYHTHCVDWRAVESLLIQRRVI